MTTTIVTRAAKGAPLTYTELDANFTNLKSTADAAFDATIALGGKANASALGVADSATNMGTFTGSTIPDNQTAKQNLQALETSLETKLPISSPTYTGIARNNAASWPDPKNSATTTATHTTGSATITVADGSQVVNGDGVYASFVAEPVYVVSGGGTNTLVMSREAASSGSGASVRFGTDRWDLNSTTVGDTAGYRRMYIGQAAKGRSTMQPIVNGQGLDYPDVTAFSCENELGGVSGWFGSRMSKENTGLAALITLGTYCLIDEDPVSRHCWNGYDQSNLLAGTEPSGSAQFIQRECSLESYWPTVLTDPFYYNEPGSTRIFRLDAGIGTYAERGEPFPNDISHYIDFVANGATAKKGIIFGYDSLDVGGGTIKPAAIALTGAGWGHAVSWYSGLETEAWKIFSTATVGNAYFWHSNGVVTSGEADLAVTKAPGFERALRLLSNNDNRWKVAATASAETGINVGSDFSIARFNDAGVFIASSLDIRRANGRVSMKDVAALDKFADNAAALSGGLVAGDLYATTAGDLRIVV